MHERGFSLVEMVMVVGIVSLLLAFGTLRFDEYAKRHRTESQTRMLYLQLQKARSNAVYERRQTRVKIYTDHFEMYSSGALGAVAPIVSHALEYPVVMSSTVREVDFDPRGVTNDWGSICLASSDGSGAVDSVVIHSVRTSIGKKDKGNDCVTDNITKK